MCPSPRLLVGSTLLLVALAVLGAGWRLTAPDRAFLFRAARATGTVVAHERYTPEGRTPRERFRLVVSFSTATGERVRFRSISSYGRPPYAVGAFVPVRYDVQWPTRARVNRPMEFVAPLIIWGAAVLLISGLGLGIVLRGPGHHHL